MSRIHRVDENDEPDIARSAALLARGQHTFGRL
jgi:hypothetical protein